MQSPFIERKYCRNGCCALGSYPRRAGAETSAIGVTGSTADSGSVGSGSAGGISDTGSGDAGPGGAGYGDEGSNGGGFGDEGPCDKGSGDERPEDKDGLGPNGGIALMPSRASTSWSTVKIIDTISSASLSEISIAIVPVNTEIYIR